MSEINYTINIDAIPEYTIDIDSTPAYTINIDSTPEYAIEVGTTGTRGKGATITVGDTEIASSVQDPSVVNTGTSTDAVFNFTLPHAGRWYQGIGVPSSSLGDEGDYYIDTISKYYYTKTSATEWLSIFNLSTWMGYNKATYTGDIDGVNTDYIIDNSYDDIQVFINGVYYTNSEYTYTKETYTVTFNYPLATGYELVIYGITYGSTTVINGDDLATIATTGNLSDANNDDNYVQDADYIHTDNNFTDTLLSNLNNQSGINTGDQYIPTALSEFSDDSTHRLVTDTQINTWDNKQDAGDYATNSALTSGLALKVDKMAGYSLISDTDLTRLASTSGTNTGDETQATILNKIGYTPANDTTVVHKTGDESISGSKNFDSNTLFVDSVNHRVGVGSNNPGYSLEVVGKAEGLNQARIGNSVIGDWYQAPGYENYAMFKHRSLVGANNYAFIQDSTGNSYFNAAAGQSISFGINASGKMRLGANGGLSLGSTFRSTDPGANNMIIEGNFGLGANNPTSKFEISENSISRYKISGGQTISYLSGTGEISAQIVNLKAANVSGLGGMWTFNTNYDVASDFFGKFGYKLQGGTTDSFKQFQIYIADSANPKMVVTGAGNVGIGTTNPGAKLESVATTEQLRLSYNGSNYAKFTVDSSGNLLIHPTSGRTYWNTPSINNNFYVYNNSDGDSYTGIQGNAVTLSKTGTQTVNIANSGNSYFNSGNVGIGTTNPTAQITQKSTSGLESAPLGNELLSNSNWTSTGWTGDFATGFTHTTGNTTVLTNTLTAANGNLYQIAFTVTGRTAGSFTITFGSVTSSSYSATSAWGVKATGTGTLSITPTTDFNGTIIISIKQITGTYSPTYAIQDNTGVTSFEIRNSLNTLNNTFIGKNSGRYNTTGAYNSAQGVSALQSNTTGNNNSAQGVIALQSNTTGNNNSAQGYGALQNNTTGNSNSAQGVIALQNNTTGNSNSAQGVIALQNNTTGNNNSAQGYGALQNNTTGNNNSAQGYGALQNNTTGAYNSAIGANAGRYLADGTTGRSTGNNGLYLGFNTKASANGTENEIVIGASAIGKGSNTAIIGSSALTALYVSGQIVPATLSTAPSAIEGGIYYNTTDKHFYGYNGTEWKQLDN